MCLGDFYVRVIMVGHRVRLHVHGIEAAHTFSEVTRPPKTVEKKKKKIPKPASIAASRKILLLFYEYTLLLVIPTTLG